MKFKKILVTGAAGYLGSRFCSWLKTHEPKAHVIGTARADLDLSNSRAVIELLTEVRPDCIFHFAGRVFTAPEDPWDSFFKDNVQATIRLLEAVKKTASTARIVIPGSAAEYGQQKSEHSPWTEDLVPRPVNPYGVSKAWQSTVALHYASQGLDVVVGRVFNLLGEGIPDRLAPGHFAAQIQAIRDGRRDPVLNVGNCEAQRDFIDVSDGCSALAVIAERAVKGEIYNVCSGRPVSIRQLLEDMIRVSGVQNIKIVENVPSNLNQDIMIACGSTRKTLTELGWQASVSLETSIGAMLKSPKLI